MSSRVPASLLGANREEMRTATIGLSPLVDRIGIMTEALRSLEEVKIWIRAQAASGAD